MNTIRHLVLGLIVLGSLTNAPSALAQVVSIESESTVTIQTPVDDEDMIYVGPDGIESHTSLEASRRSGSAPLTVEFTGLGLDAEGTYIIDFGDGSNSGPLAASGRCPQMTYPQDPHCIGVYASHTYTADGTYTAILYPYAACMWGEGVRCMMAAMLLGEATIVVGNGANGQKPVNDDDMTYEGEANVEVNGEAGEDRPGFFGALWNGVVGFFAGNDTNASAEAETTGTVEMYPDERTTASGEVVMESQVEVKQVGFFTGLWRGFLDLF